MIEDALKVTRTLHRLVFSVSLVVLVFAFSVSLPEAESRRLYRAILERIRRLATLSPRAAPT